MPHFLFPQYSGYRAAAASTPNTTPALTLGKPGSAKVGISGACSERPSRMMAMSLARPSLASGSAVTVSAQNTCISPRIRSVMAGAAPL